MGIPLETVDIRACETQTLAGAGEVASGVFR